MNQRRVKLENNVNGLVIIPQIFCYKLFICRHVLYRVRFDLLATEFR